MEMLDRDRLARYPDPYYTCHQSSSYDRATVSKDKNHWFANADRSFFLRSEDRNGRHEFVMMDESGPGAIVRFWMTFAGPGSGQGILRVYLDVADDPVIEGPAMEVLSGDLLTREPLASSVSKLTAYPQRGHNLYLPIPYARRCVVTYQSEYVLDGHAGARKPEDEKVYYNIVHRSYDPERVRVRTFSMEELDRCKETVDEVCRQLSEVRPDAGQWKESLSLACTIPAGESRSWSVSGAKAIRTQALIVEVEDRPQALRSLVLELAFDGEVTVWVPVGDFFGTGYRTAYTSTWYDRVGDGRMEAFWLMPFRKECRITLHNLSGQTVSILEGTLSFSPWKWDRRSMHFGASWHQYTNVQAGRYDAARDLNFATLLGEGVYVGDGVVVYNTAQKWWGEGDEKVYVDWETFPSTIGTGTEDYYGYAWSRPEVFTDHPFIAQPIGDGAQQTGYVCNRRYRVLDAIPFRESLVFDMELFHWADTRIDYAPVSFWYLKPGGRSLIPQDKIGAKTPVRKEGMKQ